MGRRSMATLAVFIGFFLAFVADGHTSSSQSERILDFNSRIRVHRAGDMTVTETIKVVCKGRVIKRGIIREFPTKYKDRYGNSIKVGFQVVNILRDGRRESYHIKEAKNGKKVYIGRKKMFLKPGVYTYTITYKTDRQLGFFKDFDELYWNVTGNGWTFAIDHAGAVVELPPDAEILKKAAYTGYFGGKGRDFTTGFDEEGNITFATTRPLRPKEGLTIAVSWPKGIVVEPTFQDRIAYILKDNSALSAALIGLLVLLVYYLIAWLRVGKDPARGTIIPRFVPPEGFSPAAIRFVMRMGFDHKSFASAIVNMAVKGALEIDEKDKGEYTLRKKEGGESNLTKGEQRVLRELFGSQDKIKLENRNHVKIMGAISAFQKRLKTDFEKIYFNRNSRYFIPGLVITIMSLAAVVLTGRVLAPALFIGLWLSLWTVGCYFLVVRAMKAWRGAFSSGGFKALRAAGALGATLFALPFLGGEIGGLITFSFFVSPLAAFLLLIIVLIDALFYHLLKAPTIKGRKVMDEIEGFKQYLSVAEKERLQIMNPPEKTPQLFEKYLPYALALGVENEWSEQFAGVLAELGEGRAYSPAWYHGTHFRAADMSGFATTLGNSFAGAISSSSSAPGSSSGSGGGGSSGGGGGGGGGSGW